MLSISGGIGGDGGCGSIGDSHYSSNNVVGGGCGSHNGDAGITSGCNGGGGQGVGRSGTDSGYYRFAQNNKAAKIGFQSRFKLFNISVYLTNYCFRASIFSFQKW